MGDRKGRMVNGSKNTWDRIEELLKPVKVVLSYDLNKLCKTDDVRRTGWWNEIEGNQSAFEEESVPSLPDDIKRNGISQFAMAKLLLATAAFQNHEETSIKDKFSESELTLVRDFERYNMFDILSPGEIAERIARREDIYDLVMEFYKNEYDKLDTLLADSGIEIDLRCGFNTRYTSRLNKVVEGVKEYVGRFGPIIVVTQIEKKVWDSIKKSEQERAAILASSRQRIVEAASRFKHLGQVEQDGESFKSRLDKLEEELLQGKGMHDIPSFEKEKDNLVKSYTSFVEELAQLADTLEQKRKELDSREAELEKSREVYQRQAQEEKQKIVESELKEIDALKSQLASQEKVLIAEKSAMELKGFEIEEKLRQINEVAEGKSIRFIKRADARERELNFIGRFDRKMHTYPVKLYSPLEKKTYEIRTWKEGEHEQHSRRSEPDMPWNTRSQYTLREKKFGFFGEMTPKIVVEAVSLNHLAEFERNSFDARPANLAELLSLLTTFIDRAELWKCPHIIGIASPTGWDERVESQIKAGNITSTYVSRFVSFCLVDSVTGEVVYNSTDDRMAGCVDLFRPQFDSERVEKVKKHVLDRLSLKSYAVFDEVLKETSEPRDIMLKVFYDLQREGKGKTRYIKEVGLVLQTKE